MEFQIAFEKLMKIQETKDFPMDLTQHQSTTKLYQTHLMKSHEFLSWLQEWVKNCLDLNQIHFHLWAETNWRSGMLMFLKLNKY